MQYWPCHRNRVLHIQVGFRYPCLEALKLMAPEDQTFNHLSSNFLFPEQPVSQVSADRVLLTSCWWIWIQKAAFQWGWWGALRLSASFQALLCDFKAWINNRTEKEKRKDRYLIKKYWDEYICVMEELEWNRFSHFPCLSNSKTGQLALGKDCWWGYKMYVSASVFYELGVKTAWLPWLFFYTKTIVSFTSNCFDVLIASRFFSIIIMLIIKHYNGLFKFIYYCCTVLYLFTACFFQICCTYSSIVYSGFRLPLSCSANMPIQFCSWVQFSLFYIHTVELWVQIFTHFSALRLC